jgi:hypothetical protein
MDSLEKLLSKVDLIKIYLATEPEEYVIEITTFEYVRFTVAGVTIEAAIQQALEEI